MKSEVSSPGKYCQQCQESHRFSDAKRTITSDGGQRHLCLSHAAVIHQFNVYDFTMNPKGKK